MIGKRMEPCGTPAFKFTRDAVFVFILVWHLRLEKKDFIKRVSLGWKFRLFNLKIRSLCQTRSKALLTSRKTAHVACLRVNPSVIYSTNLETCSWHEWGGRNSDCSSGIIFRRSFSSVSLRSMIFFGDLWHWWPIVLWKLALLVGFGYKYYRCYFLFVGKVGKTEYCINYV